MSRTDVAGARRRVGWWRRRPVRRALVLTHRWTSLVLGLALVVETTCGAIALYHSEWFQAANSWFYRHTTSAHPISAERAMAVVTAAHPGFAAAWVSYANGVYAIGDSTYTTAYGVDPGTGQINGLANLDGGLMGFIVNLHDCALTCQGYSGYLPALARPVPTLGLGWLAGVTWGGALLALLGLLMVLLAITGVITWWPGFRRMAHGFRVRTGKGRFARDYDLHNLIGIVAVPLVLMWGVTGAAFELPGVQNAWLAITGGHSVDPDRYTFAANPAPANASVVDLAEAESIARQRVGGQVVYVTTPQGSGSAAYYSVSLATGDAPYRYRAFFGGDRTVYVDSHDASHVSVVDSVPQPAANTFYDRVFEPAHFGWMVNGWWRVCWFVFGLTPLALGLTGLSTWLFRRKSRKRRKHRRNRTDRPAPLSLVGAS
ncbi:MAG TPA: PepSY-associated TM helix domain-containing protein [Pseudonocardiaceae bacterium]|jgi:uncharacterized iron-regulated membrane protein|nr:PepSY-associated TM helix domain-containing protein [Pseudonocardiaceae bacterium]